MGSEGGAGGSVSIECECVCVWRESVCVGSVCVGGGAPHQGVRRQRFLRVSWSGQLKHDQILLI